MAYFSPFIDETGFHMPGYNDIRDHLIDEAQGIFGKEIYLAPDSQDYEFISIMADKVHDCYQAVQHSYNNRGPSSAVGAGLDGVVKLNGIKRKRRAKSKCEVMIRGEPKTTIRNGIVADLEGINWSLPKAVTIGGGGVVLAAAECQIFDHTADAGEITQIVTPTAGWESVVNEKESTKGQRFETDPMLRARQAISTAKPSLTVLEGLEGGIAEIEEVTRYRLYENDTNVFGYYGPPLPGHSIAVIVEGGADQSIAEEIYLRKTPGAYTYGDIEVDMGRPDIYGVPDFVPIRFFRPVYRDIHVFIAIKMLPGFTSGITDDIRQRIYDYLNSLRIGDDLTLSALWAVALQAIPNLSSPIFSITKVSAGFSPEVQLEETLEIAFNEVTRGSLENVHIEMA